LILEKLPFFALSAASCVVTFIAQHEAEAVYPLALLSLTQRAANAVVACATYLEKTFWPAGLAVFYPLPDKLPVGTVILSSALLLGITAWIVAPPLLLWRRGLGRGGPFIDLLRRIARALGQGSSFLSGRLLPLRTTASSPCPSPPKEERETALPPLAVAPASCAHPYLAVGWFWFVGMLVPVIGLVQVGMQQVADRYTYLPLIGVFIMLVWGASAAVAEWEIRRPKPEGGAQFRRPKPEGREKPEARSPKGPASAPEITALQNGQAAASDIGLRPSFGFRPSGFGFPQLALAGLGGAALLACAMVTTLQLGYWHDSERLFRHALEVTRDNYVAQNNLGVALLKEGKLDEAITHYRVAVTLRPRWERPHLGLGEGLSRTGHYEEAAEQFSEALQILPGLVPALVQLGIARAQLGKPDEAVQALVEALRIAPDDVGAHNSLGSVFAQQGKHEEAVRQFEEAVRLKPDHAGAYNNLAISCKKLGRIGEAITHYREALRWQPDSLEALNNLAWLLAAEPDARFRNGAEAVALATRACELTKYQNPVPLATLAAAYAETGRFQEAVSFAGQAQDLARGSQGALAARLSAMIEAYRAGHPYHQP
jgi:Flp pilus assembly protein TadD